VNDILVLEKKKAMKIDHSDGRMRKRGVAGEEYRTIGSEIVKKLVQSSFFSPFSRSFVFQQNVAD